MKIILSPSKTLGKKPLPKGAKPTQPVFLQEANTLNAVLRTFTPAKLGALMDISPKLAALNVERNWQFSTPFTPKNAHPALWTFEGDVYTPMEIVDYSASEIAYAQEHLRILSGLYGLLRPLDLMQPYRLEMGTALKNANGKNLYDFWGTKLAQQLNKSTGAVINLASAEYAQAVDRKVLKNPIIDIVFQEEQAGVRKIVGLFAKRARGLMANFAIRNRLESPKELKEFSAENYAFRPHYSTDTQWVFTRKKAGFTLIELSMVLVIIGLVAGGILVGRDLIRASEIRSVISQIEGYKTAMNTFRLKYNCMAGDCARATTYGLGTPGGACDDGNGDEKIYGHLDGFEPINIWCHLSRAGLIAGEFKGADISTDVIYEPGVHYPMTKLGKCSVAVSYIPGSHSDYPLSQYYILNHAYNLNRTAGAMPPNGPGGGSGTYDYCMSPDVAYQLDTKMDDGLPETGAVLGSDRSDDEPTPTIGYASQGVAGSDNCESIDVTPPVYNASVTGKFCALALRF